MKFKKIGRMKVCTKVKGKNEQDEGSDKTKRNCRKGSRRCLSKRRCRDHRRRRTKCIQLKKIFNFSMI